MKGGLGMEGRRGRWNMLWEGRCGRVWEGGIEARGKVDLEVVGWRVGDR